MKIHDSFPFQGIRFTRRMQTNALNNWEELVLRLINNKKVLSKKLIGEYQLYSHHRPNNGFILFLNLLD